ncbi:MAG: UDP pyrophosphate phosphatase [Oleiphilaceae bacterium]|nr:UDP pyrophosphate phosphatase [Oleiphilaceae bacterium]
MVGGLNPNSLNPAQSEATSARARPDVARNSAASGPNATEDANRQALSQASSERDTSRLPDVIDTAAINRRVEARQAAEDSRFERFRADEMPRASSQALDVFASVAAQRDGSDVELAGIDIRV